MEGSEDYFCSTIIRSIEEHKHRGTQDDCSIEEYFYISLLIIWRKVCFLYRHCGLCDAVI